MMQVCQLCDHEWPDECAFTSCDCRHDTGEAEPGARRQWERLASEMPGWIGSEPPPDVLTEDDSWDRWPA